jgi:hypothetical protein
LSWIRALGRRFVTLTADDADCLQDLLADSETVMYDVGRRVLMFGTTPVGED